MKCGVIVAARMGSSRLPGKVMKPVLGEPLILFILKRLAVSRLAADIVLATTSLPQDDDLALIVQRAGFPVYRGAVNDVLGRYVEAARGWGWDYAVRVTGDCPLVSGDTLDGVLAECKRLQPFDLATTKPAFPRGIDYEVYSVPLLENINALPDVTAEDREHIMNYIYRHEEHYRIARLQPPASLQFRTEFLVDTLADYQRLTALLHGQDIHITAQWVAAREARYPV